MRSLRGKRVLITGGASGIGAATAARFLQEGSAVCVLDRDAKGRQRIQQALPDLAGTVDADVSDLAQVQAAVRTRPGSWAAWRWSSIMPASVFVILSWT